MDLDELQSVRDRERQTDKLQQLRESFYADAGEFIQQLRRERDRAAERADDPFDAPEVNRLTDEINTAEGTVEAIFERRIGKIVKAASLAAADQPLDAEGMTAEETILFDDLVDDIVATRQRVLDTLDGAREDASGATNADTGGAAPERNRAAADTADEPGGPGDERPDAADTDGVAAADLMGTGADDATDAPPGRDPTSPGDDSSSSRMEEGRAVAGDKPAGDAGPAGDESGRAPDPDREGSTRAEPGGTEGTPVRKDGGTGVDRETLRITADVGAIFGVDEREYDLAADDVVQLPAENARPLVERGAAERLD
jgi:DNA replication factor GINS